jgi:hypothetical protein
VARLATLDVRALSRAPWLVVATVVVHAIVAADPRVLEVGRFVAPRSAEAPPEGWEPLTFRRVARSTRYSVVRDGDGWVLKAERDAAASALYRPLDLSPESAPDVALESRQRARQRRRAEEGR